MLDVFGELIGIERKRGLGAAGNELRAEEFRQSGFSGEIIDARRLIVDVERHGQVILREEPVREAANISDIKRKPGAQFAADGEINGVRVGSLQRVVHTPSNRGTSRIQTAGESPRRRLNENRCAGVVGGGNRIHGCDSGSSEGSLDIGRIGQLGGKTKRAILIEGVGKALADAVVDDAESCPDTGLALAAEKCAEKSGGTVRRPSHGNAWTQVVVIPIVETRLAVGRACPIVADERRSTGRNSLLHSCGALIEPGVQTHGG